MLGVALDLHDTDEVYRISEEDVEVLRMFRDRTVFTIGTAKTVGTYRREMVNLCLGVSSFVLFCALYSC